MKKAKCYNEQTPVIHTREAPKKINGQNLLSVNPLKQQFEPTDASPIKQHSQMAGNR